MCLIQLHVCISECLLVACLVHFLLTSVPTLTTKMATLQALAIGLFYCSAVAYQTYCAFCDKSTKFGIHVDDYMTNKSGYGGILDLTFGDLYVCKLIFYGRKYY